MRASRWCNLLVKRLGDGDLGATLLVASPSSPMSTLPIPPPRRLSSCAMMCHDVPCWAGMPIAHCQWRSICSGPSCPLNHASSIWSCPFFPASTASLLPLLVLLPLLSRRSHSSHSTWSKCKVMALSASLGRNHSKFSARSIIPPLNLRRNLLPSRLPFPILPQISPARARYEGVRVCVCSSCCKPPNGSLAPDPSLSSSSAYSLPGLRTGG
ncbi:hypothetical protein B0O80DRAFT_104706 [Mortierella sp. GBAus27b]|nr:hypothetical protein B0O80DRAFT_104706 [Mortierella sp. GBAus27b]